MPQEQVPEQHHRRCKIPLSHTRLAAAGRRVHKEAGRSGGFPTDRPAPRPEKLFLGARPDMSFDLARILAERQGEKYALNEKLLTAQLVRVLKTLGYDVSFARGEGPYL